MSKPQGILLEDQFVVTAVDPDGKKFIKVSRIQATSKQGVVVTADINFDVYPISQNEKLTICIASTLDLTGEAMPDAYDHSIHSRATLMSQYEYVMHGRVYACNTDEQGRADAVVYVSFGGLLMRVAGEAKHLKDIHFNQNIYLLIKKAK
jgi:DNA-directed RNA polymerases I, II, and III subunit RPABC3